MITVTSGLEELEFIGVLGGTPLKEGDIQWIRQALDGGPVVTAAWLLGELKRLRNR